MDERDRAELREACRSFLQQRCPVSRSREILEGLGADLALWKEMAELGWCGALVPEEFGGSGLDHSRLRYCSRRSAGSSLPCPLVSSAVLCSSAVLGAEHDGPRRRYLPTLAEGTTIGTLALDGTVKLVLRAVAQIHRMSPEAQPAASALGGRWDI
jgi:acyl-CoA dehydrogenase